MMTELVAPPQYRPVAAQSWMRTEVRSTVPPRVETMPLPEEDCTEQLVSRSEPPVMKKVL